MTTLISTPSSAPIPPATGNPARYVSTRGNGGVCAFDEVLLRGLAPDGGLYLPQGWPTLAPELLSPNTPAGYIDLVRAVLHPFIGEALPASDINQAIDQAVGSFNHATVTPIKQIDDGLWLLELFHGPTMAFKDCAMRLMAPLASAALKKTDDHLLLITATSGDTGAAAVRAFAGADRITMVVLHPKGRVSPVQYQQMATVDAPNVLNLAVAGDFDDCQAMVKALLADNDLRDGRRVSSVNSINWGRLAGQIPYYLHACRSLGGPARFIVPTGNFGDAFAGWAAKMMGAPVAGITAAVNANDALARAINTGIYAREKAVPTASVSMDVQAPSNFERMVFEAAGRQPGAVREVFDRFTAEGTVTLPPALTGPLREELTAISIDEATTAQTMADVYRDTGEVICPHTAVGVAAAKTLPRNGAPRVVLATAHAAKFPDSVEAAIGMPPARPDAIAALDDLPEFITDIPADLAAAKREILARVT